MAKGEWEGTGRYKAKNRHYVALYGVIEYAEKEHGKSTEGREIEMDLVEDCKE